VDESLRKLRTDYIDLLLLHWPSEATPLAEQIAGLNAAVQAGKVRHIGVSNFNRHPDWKSCPPPTLTGCATVVVRDTGDSLPT
jgi:aryl-alcohol dehydrogenase-like predicted oxidoreductase